MNRTFYRYFVRSLLWLLVAKLPLQGFAAAMRSCCLQQATAVAVMEKAAAPHCHAMAATPEHGGTMDVGHGHDCGNHGACSVAATAPPPVPALHPLSLGAQAPPAALPLLFAGHIPAGLERPPRMARFA